MTGDFNAVPIRVPGPTDVSWWNALRTAGVLLQNYLGAGFMPETRFTLTNGQASPASVTGLSFDSASYTSAQIQVEIRQVTSTSELICNGVLTLIWRSNPGGSGFWDFTWQAQGDESGITFSVLTTGTVGQVQYTLGTLAGSSYAGTLKFKAISFGV